MDVSFLHAEDLFLGRIVEGKGLFEHRLNRAFLQLAVVESAEEYRSNERGEIVQLASRGAARPIDEATRSVLQRSVMLRQVYCRSSECVH